MLRSALSERDAKIATLENDVASLQAAASGTVDEEPSTGDMIQDWVRGLEK